ncbi:MAG: hypothetical protein E7534_02615 [Ruminococcaceae bacterium]|nr:hypothetical protein [Oscillospiraceae bacterium]MBQ2780700.1 hypothetical protein [Clostridia bacterium]
MKKNSKKRADVRQAPHTGDAEDTTVWDLINRYGTYNIQPTADTENPFPAIAPGNPYSADTEFPSARSQNPENGR